MTDKLCASSNIAGRVQVSRITGGVWQPQGPFVKNLVLYDWSAIAIKLLLTADPRYKINSVYLEYANVIDPDAPVAPPAFDRADGISYYNSLASSPTVDYLRVPLLATSTSNSDTSLFAADNVAHFMARSQGLTGAHGKNFSDSANSKVYGGALVSVVDLNDRTQDLVFSRFYLPDDLQQVKLANSEIGLEWILTLN